jgi:xanthine dehydrogenase/oxidase
MSSILFYVNGQRKQLHHVPKDVYLLEYVRNELGLTGSKLGCGEGGCGACTMMLSYYDKENKAIRHRAVNGCLFPLFSVDGMAVTTVEGLGSTRSVLHPVQERLASSHGSQCGFCTPGFVVAMAAFLRNNPNPTERDIERALDGNLCRCTGYRPILDAFKTFASNTKPPLAAAGCCGSGGCQKEGGCACNGAPGEDNVVTRLFDPTKFAPYEREKDVIFPPELMRYEFKDVLIQTNGTKWQRPTSLAALCAIRQEHPTDSVLMVGCSELAIEMRFKMATWPCIVNVAHVPELRVREMVEKEGRRWMRCGGALTWTELEEFCTSVRETAQDFECEHINAVLENLQYFAGNQIRNAASLAGNIATASPISDMNPVWMAAGAQLNIVAPDGSTRTLGIRENFFLAYRKTALQPGEVIASVDVPLSRQGEYAFAYKICKRRDDDIAIVNAGMSVVFGADGQSIAECTLAYGGLAPISKRSLKGEAALQSHGQGWSAEMLETIYQALEADFPMDANTPGGMVEYRRAMALSFFFKFFLYVSDKRQLGKLSEDYPSHTGHLLTSSLQSYRFEGAGQQVHQNLRHISADVQVTGEAKYVNDLPHPPSTLFAHLVLSTAPHALIKSVDTSACTTVPGFAAYIDWRDIADIKGSNTFGATNIMDEQIFAEKEVFCAGQLIGLTLADSAFAAQRAASLVRVEYEALPHVLTIEEAIEAESYFDPPLYIKDGNAAEEMAKAPHVLEGSLRMPGQEHFYFETQRCFVSPGERDELVIVCSTQGPSDAQKDVAHVTGLSQKDVVVKTKRMGGGFGGKETRSAFFACAAAVAAKKMNAPVVLNLTRDQDMMASGGRHPFLGKYKVGYDDDGRILAVEANLYSNGGYSTDLSYPVLGRALTHFEGCYHMPHISLTGRICKTNLPSNTAFRGFGGPQGILIGEGMVVNIAEKLGKPIHAVQRVNFYQEGQATPYGQVLNGFNGLSCWEMVRESAEFDARRTAVDAFNAAHQHQKRGLAITPIKYGLAYTALFMNQGGALVHCFRDGSVLVSIGGTEMGQGLYTKMTQVTAQALGVDVSQISLGETSTEKVANSLPTAASVSSDIYGMAILDACHKILERMQPVKAANPDASFAQLCDICFFQRIDISAHGFYATPDIGMDFAVGKGKPFNYFSYGASVVEVEVDVLTGHHTIVRADIVMDVGKSLNPAVDIGQVEGAFVQGTGWLTIEETAYFKNGQLFTRGPSTYKIPSAGDIPRDFRVHLLPRSNNPRAIHSSKGVGEPPYCLAAATFFAIRDACRAARSVHPGAREQELPFRAPATVERIRMACGDAIAQRFQTAPDQFNSKWLVHP